MKAKERHDIKTDRFLDTAAGIQEFLVRHGRTIMFSIGAMLIMAVGWLAISWFIDSREESAAEDLSAALKTLNMAVQKQAGGKADLAQAETMLQAVVENHGGTAAATAALFELGLTHLFQKVIESRSPLHWELASMRLGAILEREGKSEEACDVYRAVVDAGTTNMPLAFFAWKAGNCFEEMGKDAEALHYYTLARDSETLSLLSPLSGEIERKIKSLSEGKDSAAE